MLSLIEFVTFEESNKQLNYICFFNYSIEESAYNCDCAVLYRGRLFKARTIILEAHNWTSSQGLMDWPVFC